MVSTGDRRLVGYRVPLEWRTLIEEQRAMASVSGFKQSLKGDFLVQYGAFQCGVVIIVVMWGVSCLLQKEDGEKIASPSEKLMLMRKGADKREKNKLKIKQEE
jgi:hypothetical protein